jgi:2-polyprenyl-3-methyl-5-hydroxy-6-metoxy-1,4-benzoquinol methylase
MSDFFPLTKCLCCDQQNLTKILDLKEQPLANSYTKTKEEVEMFFPLALNYCNNCTHLQLTHAVNPDLLFKNYLYVSGTTKTLKQYFDEFVQLVEENIPSSNKKLSVLDIACNDGTQLDSFKTFGYNTYGIDPAENLYNLSSKNHKIVCDYLSERSIKQLGSDKFDVIVAQNVFAHNTYPRQFLQICKDNLREGGRIFIQTSQADMVKYGQFDTVYHEHISFFNIRSISELAKLAGLALVNVIRTSVHGTSYVFVFSSNPTEDRSSELIKTEYDQTFSTVEKFAENAEKTINKLRTDIKNYRERGYAVVGYGAAAKGNTILNYGDIHLDYIVDDNPLKQTLFTPGTKIPIVTFEHVNQLYPSTEIVWLPLAWNFFSEIRQNIKSKRQIIDDKFIKLDFATI